MSKFLDTMHLKYALGSIRLYNGKWISLPLYHHRPPKPFTSKSEQHKVYSVWARENGIEEVGSRTIYHNPKFYRKQRNKKH